MLMKTKDKVNKSTKLGALGGSRTAPTMALQKMNERSGNVDENKGQGQ
jgi:hypothetical protein